MSTVNPGLLSMHCKELGKTGVRLPEIGLGTWKYKGGIEPLQTVLSYGPLVIDTAESYETEDVIGTAVRGCRDKAFIATKVLPVHFRYQDVLKAADQSLHRLKTDYIDLYQLHWPNAAVPIQETMAAMETLVDAGKVRFIGVCNFSLQELKRAQASLSAHRIVSHQIQYNLVDRRADYGMLEYCRGEHITILAHSPLGCGLENIRRRDSQRTLCRVASDTGKTEAQVALNWCISSKEAIAIPKSNTTERIMENLRASGWQLSPEQVALLERSIKSPGRIEAALRRGARRILPRRCTPRSISQV